MSNKEDKINSYLSFRLGKEIYAANVSRTIKILQLSEITKVPNAPTNMIGVINHHGNVLPVIDLNQTFRLSETEKTKNTCIIILSIGQQDNDQINIGAIVDEVLNVDEISNDDISDPPSLGKANSLEHICGVFKKGDKFIMILDVDKIFRDIVIEEN